MVRLLPAATVAGRLVGWRIEKTWLLVLRFEICTSAELSFCSVTVAFELLPAVTDPKLTASGLAASVPLMAFDAFTE